MGLKALHLLQQTGKTAPKYVDTIGLGVRKWVKPTNLEGLHFAPEAIGDTVKISSKKFIPPKTGQLSFSSIASEGRTTINPMGSAEEVGLYEHGLHEIMVDPKAYQEIGQTVVHTQLREIFNPETMVEIEGEIFYYPKCPNTNILAKEYTITPVLDKYGIPCEYKVQFFDDAGLKVDAVQRLPRTSKLTNEEVRILREKGALNRAIEKPVTPASTITEQNIMGFRIPEGTVEHTLKDVGDGTQALRFLDKDGNTIRKIVLRGNTPISYSDFSSGITKSSLTFRDGHIVEETSVYNKVKTNTNYELENGKVVRSTQSKTIATHRYGKIEGRYTQKVRTSTTGNGSYLQDITIENGTKRFNIMIIQGQKGKKGQMLGNCIGLTPEEMELLKTDPFLATRYYNNNLDFVRMAHRDGMRLQGLRDTSTPLYFNAPNGSECAYYHRGTGRTSLGCVDKPYINITPFHVADNRGSIIDTLNHEPRHGVQHDMVDDLNAGALQAENIEEAAIYRDNFANYKSSKTHGYDAYYNQPVEIDARRAGEEATELFRNIGEKIDKIFGIN